MTFLGTKWDQAQINQKKLLAQALHTSECSTCNISRNLANSRASNQQVLPRKRRDAMCSTWNIPDVYRHSFKQRPNMLTPLPGCQTKSTSRYRDQPPTRRPPNLQRRLSKEACATGPIAPPARKDRRAFPSIGQLRTLLSSNRSLRSTWNIKITNFRNSIATKLLFGMFHVEHIFETDSPC